jgi:hypothetical protein
MAYTSDEYAHILRHLQRRVREHDAHLFEVLQGQADFDPHATDQERARLRLLQYLRRVIAMIEEASRTGYERSMETLTKYIHTVDGERLEGIKVDLAPGEREEYGREFLDLSRVEDNRATAVQLRAILEELEQEGAA